MINLVTSFKHILKNKKGKIFFAIVFLSSILFLGACSSLSAVKTVPNYEQPYSLPSSPSIPEPIAILSSSGVSISTEEPTIDTTHIADGYIIAAANSTRRLKFQVSCGDMSYNYDLQSDGTPIVVPVNMGSGTYTLKLLQNIQDSDYTEIAEKTENVILKDEFAPFLIPNMFCNYNEDSACCEKAREIASGATTRAEALASICNWVADNIEYDYAKAQELSASTGYVPSPDETLLTGRGVCFDYASLCTAMLRSIGIPAKMITGYVGTNHIYHAWVMVYVDGTWKTERFSVDANTWSRCDVTLAAAGETAYIGDGSFYTDRYVY